MAALFQGRPNNEVGRWLAIGIGIGAGIGVAMGNLGAGIGIGIAIGLAIGAARRKWSSDGDPDQTAS